MQLLDAGYTAEPCFRIGERVFPCIRKSFVSAGGQEVDVDGAARLYQPLNLLDLNPGPASAQRVLEAAVALNLSQNAHKPLLQVVAEQLGLSHTEVARLLTLVSNASLTYHNCS
ncbi:MAG: hypothetical protein NZ482_03715 [Gloeomargarita sp. SKYG98]|nr:hypothetical protein [Gloeomargarita sp. SKYG98]